jgi:hypothetical protein
MAFESASSGTSEKLWQSAALSTALAKIVLIRIYTFTHCLLLADSSTASSTR